MPYFSHLLNSLVRDSADNIVGRLEDMVITPQVGEYNPVDFILLKTKKNKKLAYLPYEYVENLGSMTISLKNIFANIPVTTAAPKESVRLKRDILDQQIVDMKGARVVRVNDLRLGDFEGQMCVLGIDISTRGLLRRLGLESLDVFDVFKVNLIDWRQSQPVKGFLRLNIVSKDLNKLHPADLAHIIEDLSVKQGSSLVTALDTKRAAQVFEEIKPTVQKILVKYLGAERVSEILTQMSPDEMVDLVKVLAKDEAGFVLERLKNSAAGEKVGKLMNYPGDTAGGLMSLDYLTARPNWTVADTIAEIKRASPGMRSILYIYVTSEDNTFHGAVSLRTLLIGSPHKKLRELIKQPAPGSTLKPYQPVKEIINTMTKYNLYMAAVLSRSRKLIGVVAIDDVMNHLLPNA